MGMRTDEDKKKNVMKTALVAVAVFITSNIVIFANLRFGFLSIVTVLVLMQLFFTQLRAKAVERIFGTSIAAILFLLILLIFHNHFMLMLLGSTLLLMVFVYYFAVDYFPYSMIMGAITISLISGMNLHNNFYDAFQIGMYWVINIFIGAGVVICMDYIANKFFVKHLEAHQTLNLSDDKKISLWKKHARLFYEKSVFNYNAMIVSCRVAITFVAIVLINRQMGWSFIDIQALIAGIIVSAQLTIAMTHRRALLRFIGVIVGALLAIAYAYLLQIYPSAWLLIILISVSAGILTWLSEWFKFLEYAFLQAGLMLPLILIATNMHDINTRMAIERGLGSFEGGLVAVIMVYLSVLFLHRVTHKPH